MSEVTQILILLCAMFFIMGYFLWRGGKKLKDKPWGGYYGEYKNIDDESFAEGLGMLLISMVVVGFGIFITALFLLKEITSS